MPENGRFRFFHLLNHLSLDVALGAGGLLAMLMLHLHVIVEPAWGICLIMSTWLMYNLDRLLDAGRLGERAETARHRFLARHRVELWILWWVVLGLDLVMATCLKWKWIWKGLLLAGLGLSYISAAYSAERMGLRWMREPVAAAVYLCAISMPLVLQHAHWDWLVFLPLIRLYLLFLGNMLLFSRAESAVEAPGTATRGWLHGISGGWAHAIIGLILIAGLVLHLTDLREKVALSHSIISVLLLLHTGLLIQLYRKQWRPGYRLLADASFLLCWMPLLLEFV